MAPPQFHFKRFACKNFVLDASALDAGPGVSRRAGRSGMERMQRLHRQHGLGSAGSGRRTRGLLAACGGGERSGGGLFAARERTAPIESLDAQTIYQQGEAQLERGRPDNAAELFGEVERLHPYSEWAKRGLIMAAFAYHQDRDYDNSRIAAQRFLDFYPPTRMRPMRSTCWR
jgi:tetratricopeptide (TPR) repeat protein